LEKVSILLQELLFFTCVIGFGFAAVIKNIEPEPVNAPENAVEEINENQSSDLDTAEGKHFGFGPRVVIVNKGFGGNRGCGCGYERSHYHSHHRFYGKKK